MEHILLVIHVVIAAALIGAVLLQRSDSDGFGLGSGSGANLLSGRAAASLMTRTTAILAGLFIANSLLLSVLAASHHGDSIVDSIVAEDSAEPTVPAAVGKDEDTKATKAGLNRDAVVDTDQAAKKASAKKAAPAVEEKNAPAVPAAE